MESGLASGPLGRALSGEALICVPDVLLHLLDLLVEMARTTVAVIVSLLELIQLPIIDKPQNVAAAFLHLKETAKLLIRHPADTDSLTAFVVRKGLNHLALLQFDLVHISLYAGQI